MPPTSFGGVILVPYLSDQIGLERATRNGGLTDRKKREKNERGINLVESVII